MLGAVVPSLDADAHLQVLAQAGTLPDDVAADAEGVASGCW